MIDMQPHEKITDSLIRIINLIKHRGLEVLIVPVFPALTKPWPPWALGNGYYTHLTLIDLQSTNNINASDVSYVISLQVQFELCRMYKMKRVWQDDLKTRAGVQ